MIQDTMDNAVAGDYVEDGARDRGEAGLKVKHLYEVERLSGRQIARQLGLARKTVTVLLRAQKASRPPRSFLLKPFERLIEEWYGKYPSLKAIQV